MTPFTVTRTNPRVNKVEPDEFVRSEIRPVSCERSIAICLDDFAFDSQNREKNQSWMVKVNLILHIMIKWASGYGLTRVFNF